MTILSPHVFVVFSCGLPGAGGILFRGRTTAQTEALLLELRPRLDGRAPSSSGVSCPAAADGGGLLCQCAPAFSGCPPPLARHAVYFAMVRRMQGAARAVLAGGAWARGTQGGEEGGDSGRLAGHHSGPGL